MLSRFLLLIGASKIRQKIDTTKHFILINLSCATCFITTFASKKYVTKNYIIYNNIINIYINNINYNIYIYLYLQLVVKNLTKCRNEACSAGCKEIGRVNYQIYAFLLT